jgi:hypothetical protein
MSSSDARRARRLARKSSTTPDYIHEPETADEWRAEIADYFAFYEDEEADLPIIRERIERLIEACPHEAVKAWARAEWLGRA